MIYTVQTKHLIGRMFFAKIVLARLNLSKDEPISFRKENGYEKKKLLSHRKNIEILQL